MRSSASVVCGILLGVFFPSATTGQATIRFTKDIRPILAAKCFACHGPDEHARQSGLALHQRELALTAAESGEVALVPGRPQESELIRRITSNDEFERMPPADHGDALAPAQIDLIRRWVEQGAAYDIHWAYRPLRRPERPEVDHQEWPSNDIDFFVLQKLEAIGLAPEPDASPTTLMRRVSLDLTGLPPTFEQVDTFLADRRPDAYERCVDRLLDSTAYGEHWARIWLDLARYADSQGYAQDELRTMWPYRDWVIRAFNDDMPFDQFTIEQLAGDLLEHPTTSQMIATGFHRNTMTNTEGGTDDEEFRFAAVIDRTNTTMQVWMGTTMGCAQCHSHKYDPITHAEYYRFLALLNQTADHDQPDNRPTLPVATAALRQQLTDIQAEWEPLRELDLADPAQLASLDQALARTRKRLNELQLPRTPVMMELPPTEQRTTRVAIGGSFLAPGDEVQPGVPAAFRRWAAASVDNRLHMARWLVSRDNPLTPRVAANRCWEQLFGTGLVETSEDFGVQGSAPTHPELLDELATTLVNGGWSLKNLCKTIVMSRTYRQSSRVTREKAERDPRNELLSRAPSYRLSAEQLRDYALAVSGLLSRKMYGPPVRPPQPKTGLNAAFGGSLDWEDSPGEDRYRRGIYTLWRRTNPYSSFMAMDATDRKTCTVRRIRTNTPVAAFVTLNDPAYIEMAQALARRVQRHPADSHLAKIEYAFRAVTMRRPSDVEAIAMSQLWQRSQASFRADDRAAQAMAVSEFQPLPAGEDVVSVAAWTVVANALLNLDEVLTRN